VEFRTDLSCVEIKRKGENEMASNTLLKLAATTPVVALTDTTLYYSAPALITISPSGGYTIARASWVTGAGGAAASGAIAVRSNGYRTLFVNGVLQQSILYSVVVSTSRVIINNPSSVSYTIPQSAPFTLSLAKSSLTPTKVVIP
jgi:hypothetical protein